MTRPQTVGIRQITRTPNPTQSIAPTKTDTQAGSLRGNSNHCVMKMCEIKHTPMHQPRVTTTLRGKRYMYYIYCFPPSVVVKRGPRWVITLLVLHGVVTHRLNSPSISPCKSRFKNQMGTPGTVPYRLQSRRNVHGYAATEQCQTCSRVLDREKVFLSASTTGACTGPFKHAECAC